MRFDNVSTVLMCGADQKINSSLVLGNVESLGHKCLHYRADRMITHLESTKFFRVVLILWVTSAYNIALSESSPNLSG